jgi:1-acyl-sn-glycerol-3-phosphate acyltransferase
MIFPEGKLNHGKGLHLAGSGVAVLAKKSKAPVIPIGFYVPPDDIAVIRQRVNGRETFGCWQVRGRCYVCVGKPWYAAKTLDEKPDLSLRQITGQIMAQVAELVQQAHNEAKNLPSPAQPQLGLSAHDRKMI